MLHKDKENFTTGHPGHPAVIQSSSCHPVFPNSVARGDWVPLIRNPSFLVPNTHQQSWCLEFSKSKWCYEDSRDFVKQLDFPICITALELRLKTQRDLDIVFHVRQLPLRISNVTNREVTDWHLVITSVLSNRPLQLVFHFSDANRVRGKHFWSLNT